MCKKWMVLILSLIFVLLWCQFHPNYKENAAKAGEFLFPYKIPGTDLVAEEIRFYEGPFLEDGSYEEVSDVAALVVRNEGDNTIACTQIQLYTPQRVLFFTGSWIPADSSCVLLEINKYVYSGERVVKCTGTQQLAFGEIDGIEFEEVGDAAISVYNSTGTTYNLLQLRYKTYLKEADAYMGGFTESLFLVNLQPGEKRMEYPYRYVRGYTKIIGVFENE